MAVTHLNATSLSAACDLKQHFCQGGSFDSKKEVYLDDIQYCDS